MMSDKFSVSLDLKEALDGLFGKGCGDFAAAVKRLAMPYTEGRALAEARLFFSARDEAVSLMRALADGPITCNLSLTGEEAEALSCAAARADVSVTRFLRVACAAASFRSGRQSVGALEFELTYGCSRRGKGGCGATVTGRISGDALARLLAVCRRHGLSRSRALMAAELVAERFSGGGIEWLERGRRGLRGGGGRQILVTVTPRFYKKHAETIGRIGGGAFMESVLESCARAEEGL